MFDSGLNSINIGPEIAQIETEIYLKHMNQSEIDDFYLICFKSEKWKKWVNNDFDMLDKKKLITVCGHYNFNNLPNSITNNIKITTEVKSIIMNKLIWRMYNENRISLEVAEELLDCYYNRTNKIY